MLFYEQNRLKIEIFIFMFNYYTYLLVKMNKKKDRMQVGKKIIDILLFNSKTPYREIASKLNISIGTVTNKIKQLEKEGIIKRYTIGIDYERLGYPIEVLIFAKLDKGKYPELFQKYIKNPHVFTMYDVTGNFDAVLSAKFSTRSELNTFLKRLQSEDYVDYTNTSLILNISKEEKVV